jgi:hypothetical protein
MLSFLKKICWLFLLALGVQSAAAFALLGPIGNAGDSYQVPVIAYGLAGDIGAPKNIGEEYRRNVPVLYYSYDQNFLDFFGSNGVYAVDQAYAILNSLTNVSQYSPDLSEFPTDTRRVNYTAEALSLTDLKSAALSLMMENLGLAQPVRYVWALHDRDVGPGGCPGDVAYTIIRRNFAISPTPLDQVQYSSYVNDVLYTYIVQEACTGPNPLADAVEIPVDPLASPLSAVADFGVGVGQYYTGLTRDDVGGLRYLLRTNNYNFENSGPGTVQFVTNSQPDIITTLDLALFAARARTNNAAALLALYPGLIITSTSNYFGLGVTSNVTAYVSNAPPFAPANTVALYFATNYTTNVVRFFQHTFGNIVTNTVSSRGFVTVQTLALSPSPYSPVGTPLTVVTNSKTFLINNTFSGDFFILPTNLCGATILSTLLGQTVTTTNSAITTTTNAGGTVTFPIGQSTITYFTNHTLLYLPITCPSDTVAQRQGIERIRFVRRDFDSLIGQFFYPITNEYTLLALTNSSLMPQRIQRAVTRPDFLLTAQDLGTTPADTLSGAFFAARNINFNQSNILAGLAGPGTIDSPTSFIFDKVGPIYASQSIGTNAFLTELDQSPILIWGSFDGTTNPPVVYPNGTSITNLENELLKPFVITVSIPTATVGAPYSTQFTGVGGQAPYTWLAPNGLPAGLSLSSDGELFGTPSGPPGIYDFTIRITDAIGQYREITMTLTVDP